MEFDDIRKKLILAQYHNEYVHLLLYDENNPRINELKIIIDTFICGTQLEYERFLISYNEAEDAYMARPWNKLFEFHKINKIIEYINLNFKGNIKERLKKELIFLIKQKKLNKKNEIIYDLTTRRILNIPILKVNGDDTYSLKIK